MAAEPKHLRRTLALLWARLGPVRIYFVVVLALVLVLAAIGLRHLIAPANPSVASPNKAAARHSPGVAPSAPSSPLSPTPAAPQLERAIAITEVTEAEERGPRGETFIVAKIGMAPRTTAEKDNVEIRVLFFDLDANNEMRPTDAQVTYQWITPVRDWNDPSPKYLAATYLKHRPSRRDPERLRYGGFLVRIYSDGHLQDERSKPDTLITQLRSNAVQQSTVQPAPTPTPAVASAKTDPSSFMATPSSTVSPPSSPSDLPYGKPIPGKPGLVQSPYDEKFIIDVRGFPPGTLVNDPNTNKPFRVP